MKVGRLVRYDSAKHVCSTGLKARGRRGEGKWRQGSSEATKVFRLAESSVGSTVRKSSCGSVTWLPDQ